MKQILYSHGEPAGIGVDLILRIANLKFWSSIKIPIVVISDGALLNARADLLKLNIKFHEIQDLKKVKRTQLNKRYITNNLQDPSQLSTMKATLQAD